MANDRYIRTDKNGTEIWEHYQPCSRCGGIGGSDAWVHTGWTCYECGGTGAGKWITYKKYTPEYEAKLTAQREKRQAKKLAEAMAQADEKNKDFLEAQGFNADGITYVVLGDTYSIKDELKAKGCKYKPFLGWHSSVKLDGYPLCEISVDDIYYKDATGAYRWNYYKRNDEETYSAKIKTATDLLNGENKSGEYLGEIGKRYDLELTYIDCKSWESTFGYRTSTQYLHIFADADGNTFVWKTTDGLYSPVYDADGNFECYSKITAGTQVSVKGTVKEHKSYNGIKQTVLTRCKVKGL